MVEFLLLFSAQFLLQPCLQMSAQGLYVIVQTFTAKEVNFCCSRIIFLELYFLAVIPSMFYVMCMLSFITLFLLNVLTNLFEIKINLF